MVRAVALVLLVWDPVAPGGGAWTRAGSTTPGSGWPADTGRRRVRRYRRGPALAATVLLAPVFHPLVRFWPLTLLAVAAPLARQVGSWRPARWPRRSPCRTDQPGPAPGKAPGAVLMTVLMTVLVVVVAVAGLRAVLRRRATRRGTRTAPAGPPSRSRPGRC
ncbi:hypothetical protein [Micromonospora sp. C28ISP2-4]|uniref:hypothetical protein n=1 Tax=Micromonospora sp. C28ISP2-4 TaxID=3059523 RepID=UPI00267691E2|nr:hypothetical protein [Micromonospora sp. C28ISP2-4]MDO3686908.1 hypothetical protein [Micromonospora sp. C28ISP2-4]